MSPHHGNLSVGSMTTISFTLNGELVVSEVSERELLLRTLRERFGLKSVKEGCGIGECGTCTVLIDDEPHYACLTLSTKVDGHDVKTVEFLAPSGKLHQLQEAFIKHGAVQCGYCTPGMLLSAYSLLLKNKEPDRETIKEAISGNLCRCTGYVQIEEAIAAAAHTKRNSDIETRMSKLARNPEPARTKKGKSKEEVIALLSQHDDARVIAGGTDIVVALRKGAVEGPFIDISDVPELKGADRSDGHIRINAATTHRETSVNTAVREGAKSLSLACGWVGSPQIRNMGTIGGNLVNASPAADSLAPLLIHDAVVSLESVFARREVTLEEFIVAPYKTVIERNELLVSVTLKTLPGYREGYRRVTKRATWAIARLSVAWAIREEEGVFKDVRLAIGSCTPMPFRPVQVEEFLKSRRNERPVIDEAMAMILDEVKRTAGIRPSFAYKIPVLKGILESALRGH